LCDCACLEHAGASAVTIYGFLTVVEYPILNLAIGPTLFVPVQEYVREYIIISTCNVTNRGEVKLVMGGE